MPLAGVEVAQAELKVQRRTVAQRQRIRIGYHSEALRPLVLKRVVGILGACRLALSALLLAIMLIAYPRIMTHAFVRERGAVVVARLHLLNMVGLLLCFLQSAPPLFVRAQLLLAIVQILLAAKLCV
jgi:hypothetical protein